jgi:hypothetical protein
VNTPTAGFGEDTHISACMLLSAPNLIRPSGASSTVGRWVLRSGLLVSNAEVLTHEFTELPVLFGNPSVHAELVS